MIRKVLSNCKILLSESCHPMSLSIFHTAAKENLYKLQADNNPPAQEPLQLLLIPIRTKSKMLSMTFRSGCEPCLCLRFHRVQISLLSSTLQSEGPLLASRACSLLEPLDLLTYFLCLKCSYAWPFQGGLLSQHSHFSLNVIS